MTAGGSGRRSGGPAERAGSGAEPRCQTKRCENIAVLRVFWPGNTIDVCPPCAQGLHGLASHMGFAVDFAVLFPDLRGK